MKLGGLEIAAIITALGGVVGVVIALFRYRREDAGLVVDQQAEIVNGMRTLNEELRTAYDRLKVVVECLEEKAVEEAAALKHVYADLERALANVTRLEALLNGNGK